jgi:heme A synthase
VGAVLQITLGGVVRVTGSGDACPDWPLCDGQIWPIFHSYHVALEWSHRLTGSLLGIGLIASAGVIWFTRQPGRGVAGFTLRADRHESLSKLTLVAVVLIAVVGGFGASVVLNELDPALRTLHLALAEGLALTIVAGWLIASGIRDSAGGQPIAGRKLALWATAVAFAALLSGAYAVWRGAGAVCPSWPLCGGSVLPDNTLTALHMLHRVLAAASALLAVWVVWRAFRSTISALRIAGAVGLAIVIAQVMIGAANPWTDFDEWARPLHLSLATVLLMDIFIIAMLLWPAAAASQRSRQA